jgi:hypothetical protein
LKHRGRIQAQVEKLEASEAWAQNKPPTVEEGLGMLEKLKNKIPKREADKRAKAFLKTRKFIEQASENGGLNAAAFISFNVKGSTKERIDIEVRKGLAFTPNN